MEVQVPVFLTKLYYILQDENEPDIIKYTEGGQSFVVYDTDRLVNYLLPVYFGHKNLPSFLRQLNMYGFKKKKLEDVLEFSHKYFKKDQKDLLINIKRRNEVELQKVELEIDDEFNDKLRQLYKNQSELEEMIKKVAHQNCQIMNIVVQHQKELSQNSQLNHIKFCLLGEQLMKIAERKKLDNIVDQLRYQKQQSEKCVDYIVNNKYNFKQKKMKKKQRIKEHMIMNYNKQQIWFSSGSRLLISYYQFPYILIQLYGNLNE